MPLVTNYRSLQEACRSAIAILPCSLAWLLILENGALQSKVIVTDKAESAAQVFLRSVTGGSPEHPILPLTPGHNPISDAALNAALAMNVDREQLSNMPGSAALQRAVRLLRLHYVHFLPLTSGELVGMLVLGSAASHDMNALHGSQLVQAVIDQAASVLENNRLLAYLAEREEQMRAEQAFRKMILDTMADSLIVIDDNANIQYVNNRLLNITGYLRRELIGISAGNIFHPEGRENLVKNLRRGGRGTVNFNQNLVTKDGRVVPVLMSRATSPSAEIQGQSTVLVLSDITELKAREQALERQSERLRALNRSVHAIAASLTLADVIAVILQSAGEVTNCVSACMLLQNSDQPEVFRVVAAQGPQASGLLNSTVHLGEGVAGQAARDRHPVRALKVEENQALVRAGSSAVAVPLMIAEQVIGILEVINKADGEFVQDDIETLENLAATASVAIEKARLFDQTQRRVNELSTLMEASAAVSSTLDIGSVLELITRDLREALKTARCAILTWDRATQKLVNLAEACNAYWETGKGPERPLATMMFSTGMLRTGKAILVRGSDPDLNARAREQLAQMGMSSILIAPLRFSQTVAGIVELYKTPEQLPFTGLHLQMVEDALNHWYEQSALNPAEVWRDFEQLTDLSQTLMHASRSTWCVISLWDRREHKARALRELGFAMWSEQTGCTYPLTDYPTMARSVQYGLPITLYPSLLPDDANERQLMEGAGAATGLITPLLVRGEASGLVKLLDIDSGRVFDLAEISLCQGIANVVGSALENAQLFQSLEKRAHELQVAYDDLREADKLKDSLLQSLSHELKTPLHKMTMQLELLAQDFFGPLNEEQRSNMLSLINWSTQLGDMVNNMMALHALNTQEMQFAEVPLEKLMMQVVEKARSRAERAGFEIGLKLAPGISPVRADAARLESAIEQLIDNAIKFSPNSKRIDLSVSVPDSPHMLVCVQDYGIGIPQTEFERIFQPGYQVDSSMTRHFGGTGLGLAISRRIIEAHGGKLWVESTPGHGSKFYFTVPRWL